MAKKTRWDRLLIPQPLIDASRAYRLALLEASRTLNPNCATARIAQRLHDGISDLMGEVTGQRDLFSDKAHSNGPYPIQHGMASRP